MTPRCAILAREPRLTIAHHVSPDGAIWGSRGRTIVVRRPSGFLEKFARFPFTLPRDLFGVPRLAQRAARADKCNVFVNSSGAVLAIRGSVAYRVEHGDMVPLTRIQGDCVLHGGICEDRHGSTFFGEYFMNPDRRPVRIWSLDKAMSTAQVAYEFPPGLIRHVHGIFRDPFDPDSLWVSAGDAGSECCLVNTRDGFSTVRTYGGGGQMWRAVSLFFTPDHVSWLTDSELEQNYACRMSRRDGSLEIGQKIDCPGWYGATTVEGASVAFTTVERGPGVTRNDSCVLVSTDAFQWDEVMTFRKDIFRPVQIFKYGVVSCPSGRMSLKDFWVSGEGLVGLDGLSLRLAIS